jgi:hypothetical protein
MPRHLIVCLLQTNRKIHIFPTFITWIDADSKYISTSIYFVRFESELVMILIFWISRINSIFLISKPPESAGGQENPKTLYVSKEQRSLHASSSPIFWPSLSQVLSLVQEQKARQQHFLFACFAEIISTLVVASQNLMKGAYVLQNFRRIRTDWLELIGIRKSLSSSTFPHRDNTFLLFSQFNSGGRRNQKFEHSPKDVMAR